MYMNNTIGMQRTLPLHNIPFIDMYVYSSHILLTYPFCAAKIKKKESIMHDYTDFNLFSSEILF